MRNIHTHIPKTFMKIENTHPQKGSSCPFLINPSPPSHRANNGYDFFPHRLVLAVLELHINGITQYIFFCVRLLDSTQCFCYSSMLQLESVVHSFSLLSSIPLYEYSTVFHFPINGYLGYFQFLLPLWHLRERMKLEE